MKESLQEAGEEGFQFLVQKGAERGAMKGTSFIGEALNAGGELFSTIEGQKSMLLGAVLGGATVALGLPDVKKTIEERRAIGKSPITGTLAKGFYRLGSPLATAAFTVPQVLDEEISGTDIATDPLNYLGLATMETLGKRAGTIAAPAAARAPGILGFAKDFGSLRMLVKQFQVN